MTKKITIFIICFVTVLNLNCSKANNITSQKMTLSGEFLGLKKGSKLWILDFKASKIINSGVVNEKHRFKIDFEAPRGIYRLLYRLHSKERYLDILFDKNNHVEVRIDSRSKVPKYTFFNSSRNKEWYDYIEARDKKIYKVDALIYDIKSKIKNSNNDLTIEKTALKKAKADYDNYVKSFVDRHKSDVLGHLEKGTKVWFPKDLTLEKKEEYQKYIENYWVRDINLNDENMVHTPLYYDLVKNYIGLFFKFQVKEALPKIKSAIDLIMTKFSKSPPSIRMEVTTALIDKINISDLKPVLRYLDETYVDATLVEGFTLESHIRRMNSYRAFQKGQPTPNIAFKDDSGHGMNISDIKAKYTLLAFYSSTCSHCQEQMPKLNKFLETHSNFKALAVSCDDDYHQRDYEQFKLKLSNMYHYRESKGFEGPAFKKYYIEATPTVFLLDRNKKLIKNYGSVNRFLKIVASSKIK